MTKSYQHFWLWIIAENSVYFSKNSITQYTAHWIKKREMENRSLHTYIYIYLYTLHLWRHVVCDAELQVCQDALHAVEALLPCGPQVLLHGPGHWGEDGLSCLPRVHDLPRVFGGRGQFVVVEALDVREGLLHRHHQPVHGEKHSL